MSFEPPPDHYLSLGLSNDATAAQVKTTYRKLALKYHPDKVTDESLKAAAADNFHRIQQAYEILSDDDRRAKYDASLRLAELRREVLQRQQQQHTQSYPPPTQPPKAQQPKPPPTTAPRQPPPPLRTDFRTADFKPSPSPHVGSPYTARSTERFERFEPKFHSSFDDDTDYFPSSRPSSRKQSYAEKDPKKSSTRAESERKMRSRDAEKSSRHDQRRTMDKDRRRDRESKTAHIVPDDSDSERNPVPRSRRPSYQRRESEYTRRHTSSDSEDLVIEKQTRAENTRAEHIRTITGSKRVPSMRSPQVDSVREDHDVARRSSARSRRVPAKEEPLGRDYDRQRQRSEPHIVPNERPPLGHVHSSPVDRFSTERRSNTMDTAKTNHHGIQPIRRSETMPAGVGGQRPEGLARRDSKLGPRRQRSEFRHGLATPSTSPPLDPPTSKISSKIKYVMNSDGEAVPYMMEPQRYVTRSPSPSTEKPERKTRSSSRRPSVAPPAPAPPVHPIRIPIKEYYEATPVSAVPLSSRDNFETASYPYDHWPKSAGARNLEFDVDRLDGMGSYQVFEPKRDKPKRDDSRYESSHRRSSRPAAPSRSHTTIGGISGVFTNMFR